MDIRGRPLFWCNDQRASIRKCGRPLFLVFLIKENGPLNSGTVGDHILALDLLSQFGPLHFQRT